MPPLRVHILALLLVAILAAPAAAAPGQPVTFEAPRELLDEASRDAALDEIGGLGVERLRVLVYWDQFAPSPGERARPAFDAADPAAYPAGAWDRLDRLFDAAGRRGMMIGLALTGPVPRWATHAKRDRVTDPSPKEFGLFATAVGRRYGDRVTTWSIWNEPNHPQFLMPQFRRGRAASPRIYRRLFLAGAAGLRATPSNASDQVLAGETAPRGTPRVVAPLRFLRGALCLNSRYRPTSRCRALPADGWAHHPYTTRAGPFFKPSHRDDVTIGVLRRLVHALDRSARAGAIGRRLPVHLTEFGIQSEPDPFVGVSLARQAEYLAIAERLAWRQPRVKSFSQYLLHDDQPRAGSSAARYGGFESGLRAADGTVKPAWHGFRLPLTVDRRGSFAQVWGFVRPARSRTSVSLLGTKGRSWVALRTLQTDARGAVSLRLRHTPGRRYRLRWTGADGTVHEGPPIRAY